MNVKVIIIDQLWRLYIIMNRMTNQNKVRSAYRGQGKVLSILKDFPEMTRTELAERINIGRQALSSLLLKLEKSGLILREAAQDDRRRMIIRLTEEGRAAAEAADMRTSPLPCLMECLDEEELLLFNNFLDRIISYHNQTYPDFNSDSNEKTHEDSFCLHCTGPGNCAHDYLDYGHAQPNPKYCKYHHLFETEENPENGK